MTTILEKFPEELKKEMVDIIEQVVGEAQDNADQKDDLDTNFNSQKLITTIYKKAGEKLPSSGCKSARMKVGGWKYLISFHEDTKLLFFIMRDQTLARISHSRTTSHKPHYLKGFCSLNDGVIPHNQQMRLQGFEWNDQPICDNDINSVVESLGIERSMVENFAVICFDPTGLLLRSVRVVLMDRNLNQLAEQSLNSYISVYESHTVEQVEELDSPQDNPVQLVRIKKSAVNPQNHSDIALREDEKQSKESS